MSDLRFKLRIFALNSCRLILNLVPGEQVNQQTFDRFCVVKDRIDQNSHQVIGLRIVKIEVIAEFFVHAEFCVVDLQQTFHETADTVVEDDPVEDFQQDRFTVNHIGFLFGDRVALQRTVASVLNGHLVFAFASDKRFDLGEFRVFLHAVVSKQPRAGGKVDEDGVGQDLAQNELGFLAGFFILADRDGNAVDQFLQDVKDRGVVVGCIAGCLARSHVRLRSGGCIFVFDQRFKDFLNEFAVVRFFGRFSVFDHVEQILCELGACGAVAARCCRSIFVAVVFFFVSIFNNAPEHVFHHAHDVDLIDRLDLVSDGGDRSKPVFNDLVCAVADQEARQMRQDGQQRVDRTVAQGFNQCPDGINQCVKDQFVVVVGIIRIRSQLIDMRGRIFRDGCGLAVNSLHEVFGLGQTVSKIQLIGVCVDLGRIRLVELVDGKRLQQRQDHGLIAFEAFDLDLIIDFQVVTCEEQFKHAVQRLDQAPDEVDQRVKTFLRVCEVVQTPFDMDANGLLLFVGCNLDGVAVFVLDDFAGVRIDLVFHDHDRTQRLFNADGRVFGDLAGGKVDECACQTFGCAVNLRGCLFAVIVGTGNVFIDELQVVGCNFVPLLVAADDAAQLADVALHGLRREGVACAVKHLDDHIDDIRRAAGAERVDQHGNKIVEHIVGKQLRCDELADDVLQRQVGVGRQTELDQQTGFVRFGIVPTRLSRLSIAAEVFTREISETSSSLPAFGFSLRTRSFSAITSSSVL